MCLHRHRPPYKTAGAVLLAVLTVLACMVYLAFRGDFRSWTELALVSPRAGLVVTSGAKVTYNGVEIGEVGKIASVNRGAGPAARLTLEVDPDYLSLIPANVDARINASTVFGNKYVALSAPEHPAAQRISGGDEIYTTSVTTEFNTLFETVMAISEQVDPIDLNQVLTATAQALTGLGATFGESLEDGNHILEQLNPQLPQLRTDVQLLADLAEVYTDASPDLWEGLDNATVTARTVGATRSELDAALMAAIGFDRSATPSLERAGPYLVRGAKDLLPTSKLLDDYRGMIFCTFRNYHDVAPKIHEALGGDNGYALAATGTPTGAGNPYIYPDNLPRVNASGGPEGRPGCWQEVTRDLYPFPYLVMDTGYSLAPYNHVDLGQPSLVDHVWGRQLGELSINP